jgi:hypothetical protein
MENKAMPRAHQIIDKSRRLIEEYNILKVDRKELFQQIVKLHHEISFITQQIKQQNQ